MLDLFPEFARLVRERPAGEEPYTAVRSALLDIASTRATGVALLFSGLPGRVFSQPAMSAMSVLLELEDGLADALRDRLAADDSGLRASVLARACVAALRATVLAFHELPEEERTLESARGLADRAFDVLRAG